MALADLLKSNGVKAPDSPARRPSYDNWIPWGEYNPKTMRWSFPQKPGPRVRNPSSIAMPTVKEMESVTREHALASLHCGMQSLAREMASGGPVTRDLLLTVEDLIQIFATDDKKKE